MSYRTGTADLHRQIPETAKGFAALSQRCQPCFNLQAEALMKTGAPREEPGSVLAICVQMGGGPALMYAAHALATWDGQADPPQAG